MVRPTEEVQVEVREPTRDPEAFAGRFREIEDNIEQVVRGKRQEIRLALVALLAEGHLLIEDVPGVGKTMLAKAIARSIDCSFRRIQFTPDMLPTDITGVNVFNQEHGDFEFKPGAVFANIVLGDEINRASPKTQSALLECMEERQVTIDAETRSLGTPFMVIATQNPVEHEGTYPLPEAQLDRFMLRLSIGYPERRDRGGHPLEPRRRSAARRHRARDRRARHRPDDRARARGPRGARAPSVHRRPGRRHPPAPRPVPRRRPRASIMIAARRPRLRGVGRAGLRGPRGHQDADHADARSPRDRGRRRRRWRAAARRPCWMTCSRRSRCRSRRAPDAHPARAHALAGGRRHVVPRPSRGVARPGGRRPRPGGRAVPRGVDGAARTRGRHRARGGSRRCAWRPGRA